MIIDVPKPEDIPALRRLWQQAFGDTDSFLDGFFRAGFSGSRCLYENGTPAAALYWFDCQWQEKKLAYLYAVATDEVHRGRGLCRALMEDTHRHLRRLGYAGALLVPGDAGLFRLYGGLGYTAFCPMARTTVAAAGSSRSVRRSSAGEYARLRRELLPPGSVWQEGQTLDFLASFAGFYAGPGVAFCGLVENGVFYFQEFIGDVEQIPGILRHFSCDSGEVRIFGTGTPFAMYLPLDGTDALPAYFGIPLD